MKEVGYLTALWPLELIELGNNGQLFSFLMHRYGYLEIFNDGRLVGKYCEKRTGQNILLTGDQIFIKFHSSYYYGKGRFWIFFKAGPHGKYFS